MLNTVTEFHCVPYSGSPLLIKYTGFNIHWVRVQPLIPHRVYGATEVHIIGV